MDYVVGSVAALISGNVTPNRPKLVRKALTPTKHQPSPNVTPKSEFVEDRSIFLSPTQLKKKAIIKKSPKRIFQNPDLDVTEGCEGSSSLTSPKAEKVKKHLKDELEAENMGKNKSKSPNSTLDKSSNNVSHSEKAKIVPDSNVTNGTPKKKKNKKNSESNGIEIDNTAIYTINTSETNEIQIISPKKKQPKSVSEKETDKSQTTNVAPIQENSSNNENNSNESGNNNQAKKNKKQKKKNKKFQSNVESTTEDKENNKVSTETEQNLGKKKKKKNRKNKSKTAETNQSSTKPQEGKMEVENGAEDSDSDSDEIKSRNIPNPNAITEKDSDSEHYSDDEIESENEEANEKVLTNENAPESSDEEEEESKSSNNNKNKQKEKGKEEKGQQVKTEDEIKRTLFVGNVPFSKKCKKEIKKIFSKYGQIDTIRIRTIPVKDARVTPKLAIIKNELHPERSTVNVYIKYSDSSSVGKAIAENNTVLSGNHLRVTRSDSTGSEHDPRCAVFVGNLPFAVEDDMLRSKFENCGEITSVRIIRDKKTNAGKGFGYINFASKDGVELALALSEEDLTIKNRILRVKRCTPTQGKPGKNNMGRQGNEGGRQGHQGGRQVYQGGRQGYQGGKPGYQGGIQGSQGFRQGYQGGKQGQGIRQGNRGGWQGNNGGRQGNQGGREQGGGGKWGQQEGKWLDQGPEGAARRLMNKRKFQESSSGDGPPEKRQNVTQPAKEKKQRKEFVGMTADKKKKHKFDKGQKKKKALSEILTKKA